MPDANNDTSWTISVSHETDVAVRSFMAQRGLEAADFSRFIEDAVRWRVLDQTMAEARTGFADLAPEAFEAIADEALTVAREGRKAAAAKTG